MFTQPIHLTIHLWPPYSFIHPPCQHLCFHNPVFLCSSLTSFFIYHYLSKPSTSSSIILIRFCVIVLIIFCMSIIDLCLYQRRILNCLHPFLVLNEYIQYAVCLLLITHSHTHTHMHAHSVAQISMGTLFISKYYGHVIKNLHYTDVTHCVLHCTLFLPLSEWNPEYFIPSQIILLSFRLWTVAMSLLLKLSTSSTLIQKFAVWAFSNELHVNKLSLTKYNLKKSKV